MSDKEEVTDPISQSPRLAHGAGAQPVGLFVAEELFGGRVPVSWLRRWELQLGSAFPFLVFRHHHRSGLQRGVASGIGNTHRNRVDPAQTF